MDRREFIKSSCSLCFALGSGLTLASLESCSPAFIYKTEVRQRKLHVPLSIFADKIFVIVSSGLDYNIALKKIGENLFFALRMQCTHEDFNLTSTGDGFHCNLHGSKFNDQGIVTKGPAVKPMIKYNTEVVGDDVIINLF